VAYYKSKHTLESLVRSKSIKKAEHHSQIFSAAQETELSDYLKSCCFLNHGLTTIETRKLAHTHAIKNRIKIPVNWKLNNIASADWLIAFLKRNARPSIRKPEATSQARAAGFNQPVVSLFSDHLRNVYAKHNQLVAWDWLMSQDG
ncbi:Uncharacterized protein APZ42_008723, partial [Daphnia magna]